MINQEENICRPYHAEVSCFEEIPHRFEVEGSESCSVIIPPGYSIYIEEFILEDPGLDNFVLVDGLSITFSSKVKWEDRENTLWKNLHRYNPLNYWSTRRSNYACAQTLKVFFLNNSLIWGAQ